MNQACNQEAVKEQFNRTEGQVLGIGRMVEAGRSCAEVLQQIVAARASLQKLGTMLLQAEARGCFTDSAGTGDRARDLEKIVASLFRLT